MHESNILNMYAGFVDYTESIESVMLCDCVNCITVIIMVAM